MLKDLKGCCDGEVSSSGNEVLSMPMKLHENVVLAQNVEGKRSLQ
jgi:hypothetical protein